MTKSQIYYRLNREVILARNAAWRKRNPQHTALLKRKWAIANRGKVRQSNKRFRENNPEKTRERHAIYNLANRDNLAERSRARYRRSRSTPEGLQAFRARKRAWREKNKGVIAVRKAKWRKSNFAAIKARAEASGAAERRRAYFRKWTSNNKFACLVGGRIRQALKKFRKSKSTERLIGCSLDELRSHLQKQFTGAMQWNNQGSVWQIDHIVPCAAFDLSQPEQQVACFHWSNLQPLLSLDNQRKSSRHPVTGILIRRKTGIE